ncbi:MAG TPA: DUF4186 domain-containing protein [Anaerolineales bacterium]|nr:DUF4186 domain-containing protein [Anaerolineales bacterium]
MDEVLTKLKRSSFRSRFRLDGKEVESLRRRGLSETLKHAAEFIEKRLAPAYPANDGRQTPWRNHPVFVAQHATATCCRGCLQKWHQIPKGRALTAEEQQYIVEVIGAWLSQYENGLDDKQTSDSEHGRQPSTASRNVDEQHDR